MPARQLFKGAFTCAVCYRNMQVCCLITTKYRKEHSYRDTITADQHTHINRHTHLFLHFSRDTTQVTRQCGVSNFAEWSFPGIFQKQGSYNHNSILKQKGHAPLTHSLTLSLSLFWSVCINTYITYKMVDESLLNLLNFDNQDKV